MDTSEDPRPIFNNIIMIPKRTNSYLDFLMMSQWGPIIRLIRPKPLHF